MSNEQVVLVISIVVSAAIGFLSGIGTQWTAFKRVFGDFTRLLLAGSNAIDDNRLDENEVRTLHGLGQTFVLSFIQFWKAVFGR